MPAEQRTLWASAGGVLNGIRNDCKIAGFRVELRSGRKGEASGDGRRRGRRQQQTGAGGGWERRTRLSALGVSLS